MKEFKREEQNIKFIKNLIFDKNTSVRELINLKCFENTLDYPSRLEYKTKKICEHCGSNFKDNDALIKYRKAQKDFRIEDNRLYNLFKETVFYESGITDHPKAETLFGIAWELGHSYGLNEVLNHLEDILPLIQSK